MAATTESKKMITLCSSDGEEFKFKENIARGSQTIKHMIKDDCAESMILLPNDNGKILSKVIEYFKKHMCTPHVYSLSKSNDKRTDEELKA